MENKYNNFCLILQGYPISKEQLLDIVKKYSKNFKNIVVSSYSTMIHPELEKYCKIVKNDDKEWGDKVFESIAKHAENIRVTFRYTEKDTIEGTEVNNLFAQIITTRRGILIANKEFPNCEYYMKIRADMYMLDLDKNIDKWTSMDLNLTNDIFEAKLISRYVKIGDPKFTDQKIKVKARRLVNGKLKLIDRKKTFIYWYLDDTWVFGKKNDIIKYYSFNKITSTAGETGISSSYILSYNPKINYKEAYYKYFYMTSDTKSIWYKNKICKIYPDFLV